MSYELRAWVSYDAITALVSKCASDRDRDGKFPYSAFDGLRQLRLISQPPLDAWNSAILLRVLAAVGRGDLSVGRIFEGHVNALLLIRLFGTTGQRERYQGLAAHGSIFGVWNTDLPEKPLLRHGDGLSGSKNFASGADGLSSRHYHCLDERRSSYDHSTARELADRPVMVETAWDAGLGQPHCQLRRNGD